MPGPVWSLHLSKDTGTNDSTLEAADRRLHRIRRQRVLSKDKHRSVRATCATCECVAAKAIIASFHSVHDLLLIFGTRALVYDDI